jgi:hypothetical protein
LSAQHPLVAGINKQTGTTPTFAAATWLNQPVMAEAFDVTGTLSELVPLFLKRAFALSSLSIWQDFYCCL